MKNKSVQFIDSIKLHLENKRKSVNFKENIKINLYKIIPCFILFLMNFNIIIKFIVIILFWILITVFFDHRAISQFTPTVNIWFGVPGCGKTSMGAWLTKQSIKHHYKVLSNVHIDGAYVLEESDLGNYDMSFDGEGCHVIYDEATVNGLDNRNFKSFSQSKKTYFSTHRHQNNRVDVFSQDFDVDLKIKGRAGSRGLFHLTRLPIKGFVMYRNIGKIMFIKKDDKQFVDGFKYVGIPRICYTRSVWGSFDTLDLSLCPKAQKEWKKWVTTDEE